jgi:hypothetical protein
MSELVKRAIFLLAESGLVLAGRGGNTDREPKIKLTKPVKKPKVTWVEHSLRTWTTATSRREGCSDKVRSKPEAKLSAYRIAKEV